MPPVRPREALKVRRKATRQSRGPNALEKAHIQWLKERCACTACGNSGPVICHHVVGSAYKVKVNFVSTHIGHAFVLALCPTCDDVVTSGSRRLFRDRFGDESELWHDQYGQSPVSFDDDVVSGILNWSQW